MNRDKNDLGHYFPERVIREAGQLDASRGLPAAADTVLRPMEEAICRKAEDAIREAHLLARDTVLIDRAEFEKLGLRVPTESTLKKALASQYTAFSSALASARHPLARDVSPQYQEETALGVFQSEHK